MAKTKNPTITVELSPTTEEPTPATTTTSKPVEQMTIPVRPALVTVANLLTTTTAVAAASGPAGLAIAAGAAVTGAALARHHHNERRTRQQRETTRQMRRLAGLGRGSGGLGGLGLGGFGKGTRAGHGKPGGLGTHSGRKHRNPLGGLGSALKRATSPRHGGHPTRNGGPHSATGRRHHPSHVGGSRTPHGPLSRLRRHPTVQAAHRAIRRTAPVARAIGKATLLGLGGLGWLLHHLYKAMRRLVWVIRRLLKPHENEPEPQTDSPPHVGDTVDEPEDTSGTSGTDDQQKPTNRPAAPQPGRIPAMSGTSGLNPNSHQGTSPMFMIIKAACDQIASIQHKGNLTTRAEAYDMPACIALIGQVIGLRADAYRKESLDHTFVDLYVKAEAAMYAVANQLLPLGSYFDALHPERVRDLMGGTNPAAWDTTNNQTIG